MNKQEIFNAAVKGLAAQHFSKAVNEYATPRGKPTFGCAYRGNDGHRCAIGQLIKEEFYDKAMEGKTPGDAIVFKALKKSCGGLDEDVDISFLEHMQACHDNANDEYEMVANLRSFAERYDLTIPKELF